MIDDVVFMRHARTSFNREQRMQGQIDMPLDIVGQWQADQSAYELAQLYYWAKVSAVAHNEKLLAQPGPQAAQRSDINEYRESLAATRHMTIVASDLFRAQQTAHAFADLMKLDVLTDPRLRERDFGKWDGLTLDEIRAMDADAYAAWEAHEGGELAYGVESLVALGERGAKTMNSLLDEHENDGTTMLMVVGHGWWIMSTIMTLLGFDVSEASDATAEAGTNVDTVSELSPMRNAFWARMKPHRNSDGSIGWMLEEYNKGPRVAGTADWENGPAELLPPEK